MQNSHTYLLFLFPLKKNLFLIFLSSVISVQPNLCRPKPQCNTNMYFLHSVRVITYTLQKYDSKTCAKYLQGEARPLRFLSPVLKKGACFTTSVTMRMSVGEDIQRLGLIDKLKNTNSRARTMITDHLLRYCHLRSLTEKLTTKAELRDQCCPASAAHRAEGAE